MGFYMKLFMVSTFALLLSGLNGCATFEYTKAAPVNDQTVNVRLSGEDLSKWSDMPIGVHRVPDSQLVISGHQDIGAGTFMFGLLGVAASHASNSAVGEELVKKAEQILKVSLNDRVTDSLKTSLASGNYNSHFMYGIGDSGNNMLVTPGIVMTYVNEKDLILYVILKANITDKDQQAVWTMRYIASSQEPRPLMGEGSWTENDGVALKEAIEVSLARAMHVMLRDAGEPYPRNESTMVMVEGNYPFVRQRFEVKAFKLSEDDHTVVIVPKIGDVVVFAGVNILNKKNSQYRQAKADDPNARIIQDNNTRPPVPPRAKAVKEGS
jgi:hypothetical protein